MPSYVSDDGRLNRRDASVLLGADVRMLVKASTLDQGCLDQRCVQTETCSTAVSPLTSYTRSAGVLQCFCTHSEFGSSVCNIGP